MGFQVFPEPTPATDFETLGIAVTSNTAVEGVNVVAPSSGANLSFVDYPATATVTAGVYLTNYTLTNSNTAYNYALVFGENTGVISGGVTSGTVITSAFSTGTSFTARMRSGHINQGQIITGTNTSDLRYMYVPEDTRPVIAVGGIWNTGQDFPQVWIATNGSSFTGRNIISTVGTQRFFNTAWHDGSNFYAVPDQNAGSDFIWWSTNGGVNWTTRATARPSIASSGQQIFGGMYDPTVGRHYVWTNNPQSTWTSTNGINWSTFTSGFTSSNPYGFSRAGNFLFTHGRQGGGDTGGSLPKLTISTNGINWAMGTITNVTSIATTDDPITRVAANTVAGTYVAVTSKGQIFLSTNVTNWNSVKTFSNNPSFVGSGYATVVFGDGIWIAVGGGSSLLNNECVAVSTNGVSWVTVGGTQGVAAGYGSSSGATTYAFYVGAAFNSTGRATKWTFYTAASSQNTISNFDGSMLNLRSQQTQVLTSNNALGRPLGGISAALQRFKLTRNIL